MHTVLHAAAQAVTEKYGAPDILVNNAGITKELSRSQSLCNTLH